MNNFKPRLFHIKNEKTLWKFFERHAGYNSEMQIYLCAGVAASDTRVLWEKLIEAWKNDIACEAKIQLEA